MGTAPNARLVTVNRAGFALVAVVAVAALALPRMVTRSAEFARSDQAIEVPTIPEVKIRRIQIPATETNPFDPAGTAWEPAPEKTTEPESSPGGDRPSLNGVLRIGPLQGVFTNQGFIGVGEKVGAGRLRDVGSGGVVIETSEGTSTVPIPGSRNERLQNLPKSE